MIKSLMLFSSDNCLTVLYLMYLFSSVVSMSMILVTAAQPVLVLLMKVKQKTVGSRGQKQCLENINHLLTVKNTKLSIFNNFFSVQINWNNITIMRLLRLPTSAPKHSNDFVPTREVTRWYNLYCLSLTEYNDLIWVQIHRWSRPPRQAWPLLLTSMSSS